MKKRILLISYNNHPEPTGVGNYTGEIIEWLDAKGHDCTVLNSYPYNPYWKVQEPYCKKRFLYSMEERTDSGSNGKLKHRRRLSKFSSKSRNTSLTNLEVYAVF